MLYRLCVEGLLHHWDQRRGISSDFTLSEKLRVCRELALAMQADDRAEYDALSVHEIFTKVLGDGARAAELLEHIRYRTGLLLERRPGIYAFAHLTFQEYLAALAVSEGNRRGVDITRLVNEHADSRWAEVIALYCGSAPTPAARDLIDRLIGYSATNFKASVLAEAYLSAGPGLSQDAAFRHRVLHRIAAAPYSAEQRFDGALGRFPDHEVAFIANDVIGERDSGQLASQAFYWLVYHSERIYEDLLLQRLYTLPSDNAAGFSDITFLLLSFGADAVVIQALASWETVYHSIDNYTPSMILNGIVAGTRNRINNSVNRAAAEFISLVCFRTYISIDESVAMMDNYNLKEFVDELARELPRMENYWLEVVSLSRLMAQDLRLSGFGLASVLSNWADSIEEAIAARAPGLSMAAARSAFRAKLRHTRGQRT